MEKTTIFCGEGPENSKRMVFSHSYRTLSKVEARRSNALEPTGSVGIYRTMFFNKVKYLPLLRSKC